MKAITDFFQESLVKLTKEMEANRGCDTAHAATLAVRYMNLVQAVELAKATEHTPSQPGQQHHASVTPTLENKGSFTGRVD